MKIIVNEIGTVESRPNQRLHEAGGTVLGALPHTGWWLRRCEQALSISGWSSLRTRWPGWSPEEPRPALTGNDITKFSAISPLLFFSLFFIYQPFEPSVCFPHVESFSSQVSPRWIACNEHVTRHAACSGLITRSLQSLFAVKGYVCTCLLI